MSSLTGTDMALGIEKQECIENLVIEVPTLTVDHCGQDAQKLFDGMPQLEGLVVLEEEHPAGLIMRTYFYQKIGTLYGHSLFMSRQLRILMETSMLIVDASEDISSVVMQAMEREHEKLYDYIVVTKEDRYIGVISIRQFLTELTRHREKHIATLNEQRRDLMIANQQEITLRTNLEQKMAAEKNLLDNAGQGFLSFGSDLKIKNEYSAECRKIFRKEIGNLIYTELLSEYLDPEKTEICEKILESYFRNQSPVKDNAYLLLFPTECAIFQKTIRFEYKRIEVAGTKMMMVILTDITDKKRIEKKMDEERRNQRLVLKTVTYREQIMQLTEELKDFLSSGFQQLFSDNAGCRERLNECFRIVHTFKGDFSQYGYLGTAESLQKTEELLSRAIPDEDGGQADAIRRHFSELRYEDVISGDMKVLYETFGTDYFEKTRTVEIPRERLEVITEQVKAACSLPEQGRVADLMKGLQWKNLRDSIEQFRDYLLYLSGRLQKLPPVYTVRSEDIYADVGQYRGVLKSMGHLYRNMMDHGIEPDEERVAAGKSAEGNIFCEMKLDDHEVTILLKDDGRGIDLDRVRQKAIAGKFFIPSELEAMNEDQLADIIFLDGFSTKESADMLSGRGVGMAALKGECEKLGGTVRVSTEAGRGTAYYITLPYLR